MRWAEGRRKASEWGAGGPSCPPVPAYTCGKFGTISLNQTRGESWRGAFVVKAVGGYGYSGWIWETAGGAFRIKQGPKLLSLQTAAEREAEPPSITPPSAAGRQPP